MYRGLKIIWKTILFILKLVLYFIIALIFVVAIEYLISPVYKFPDPSQATCSKGLL